jgi:VWFA-related protein
MKHACALLFVPWLLALQAAPAARAQAPTKDADQPTFPAGTELVTVDALVLDQDGRPLQGLTRDEFVIKEDGRPQSVTSFEAVVLRESPATGSPTRLRVATNTLPPPRAEQSFVIVFDDANISQFTVGRGRKAVEEFVRGGLRAGDEVTLVPTSGGAWWTARLPEGLDELTRYLERLDGKRRPDTGAARISDFEAMQITLGREPQILAHVARRYYENGIIADPPPAADARGRAELDISPGIPLIRAKAQEVYTQAKDRLRQSYAVLERVAQSLTTLRGRKSVLLVSEGFIFDTTITEYRDFVRAARAANAALYFVDTRGLEGALGSAGLPGAGAEHGRDVDERDTLGTLVSASREADGARSAAADTGGFSITNTNELAKGMRAIAEESRNYYLLGYVSTNAKRDGKFRKIEVRVTRPGADVRARRGYYAPTDGVPKPAGKDSLDPRVRSALDSPHGASGVPLRLTSYVLGPASEGKSSVLLAADVDVRALRLPKGADGRFAGVLETYVVVARDNGENANQEKLVELSLPDDVHARLEKSGLPLFRDFTLAPGEYQARLLVRERSGGRLGSVRHSFSVPAAEGLHTSTPILTDSVQAEAPGAPPRPVPLARREFASGARLFYAFEVYGAAPDPSSGAPRVATGYVVRRPDGTTLSQAEPRALTPGPRGQLSQMLSLSLQGAAAGEYELVLTVVDQVAGKTLEVTDPFSVAAAIASR